MLLAPVVLFLATLPFTRKLKPELCMFYRIAGGIIVIAGSAFSFYLAAYSGDQGGIGAFYFQLTVITVYVLFSVLLVILNWFLHRRGTR